MDADTFVERSKAVATVVLTSQQLFKAIGKMARRHELTQSQFNALRVLRGAGRRGEELTQAELADRLIASRANTTWILDRLEERKLVRRKPHPDRRKHLVELTRQGREMLTRLDPEFEAFLNSVLGGVSQKELASIVTILSKFKFDV